MPTANTAAQSSAAPRDVERGDVYGVLPDHRLLNLNMYRGVQIIDLSDIEHPKIEGRLAVSGTPVELYVVNDRAFVLLNNWQGYYGQRDDVKVESARGGLVLSVDIHDRAHPTLVDQTNVPGNISTSRLVQGGGKAALYVAASNYNDGANTVVESFDVSDGKLTQKSMLDLGGYVQDIQATAELLMVASQDFTKSGAGSQVSLIDISNPDGTMVQGGTIQARGPVQNKFQMDAYKGVLRVAAGADYNGDNQSHLQTFDISDLQHPAAIADCPFGSVDPSTGQPETLYASLFIENKAFFVTHYRVDPFHAFAIDDQGHCAEHGEFKVSGWNDFLRATMNETRLIGIGHDDANQTLNLSVSLYDATDLTNPNPLEARANIDLSYSYSQATWDDRGFSVVEGAVSVKASDGTTETGLVLLPYEGWDDKAQTQFAQVQIFTFSDHTLTKRGTMDHGSPVNRSFLAAPGTTANLSDSQLSLFNSGDPGAPAELARLDLAPDYSQLFVFGDYVVRIKQPAQYFATKTGNAMQSLTSSAQILARSDDPDSGTVIASFDLPAGANLYQVGNLLVSVLVDTTYDQSGVNPPQYDTHVQAYDLSDPTQPRARGSLETDRITAGGGIYPVAARGLAIDCIEGCGGFSHDQAYALGNALAFVHTESQQKSLGMVHDCSTYASPVACAVDISGKNSCGDGGIGTYYSGGIDCVTPQGGKQTCTGSFSICDASGCQPTDQTPPGVQTTCSDYEQFRYWTSYAFDSLDLSDPDNLVLAPRLSMPSDDEGTSLLASGTTLYFNYQQPYTLANDARSYVKRYVQLIDFSKPQQPSTGESFNVPGDVIAVDGADGNTLYTRDSVWNGNDERTLVARLTLSDNLAHLQASQLFADRVVSAVALDGAGHVLVSSDPAYGGGVGIAVPGVAIASVGGVAGTSTSSPTPQAQHRLSILDAQTLESIGEADVDAWATFEDAKQGRALFQVSGGLLVFDVEDAAHPKAQAYFATSGWPDAVYFDGQDIMFAAGPYGIYRFDASVFNLLSK